jgi:hypothetical protein
MEGSTRGDGYVRDFKAQTQSSKAAPGTAQEQAPGALSGVLKRSQGWPKKDYSTSFFENGEERVAEPCAA